MPFEDTKILIFNQYQNSDKSPFVIYAKKGISLSVDIWCSKKASKCLLQNMLLDVRTIKSQT